MKPRPRWEVRLYAINPLAKFLGLPATKLVRTKTYRWRWLAYLNYSMWATTPSIAGSVFWAEIHRAAPKLRAVEPTRPGSNPLPAFAKPAPPPNPPAPPSTARSSGKGHSESVGVGRAPTTTNAGEL